MEESKTNPEDATNQVPHAIDIVLGKETTTDSYSTIYNILQECFNISRVEITIEDYASAKDKVDAELYKLEDFGVEMESDWVEYVTIFIFIEMDVDNQISEALETVMNNCQGVSSISIRVCDYPSVKEKIEDRLNALIEKDLEIVIHDIYFNEKGEQPEAKEEQPEAKKEEN